MPFPDALLLDWASDPLLFASYTAKEYLFVCDANDSPYFVLSGHTVSKRTGKLTRLGAGGQTLL